jgi:hypothetical protein
MHAATFAHRLSRCALVGLFVTFGLASTTLAQTRPDTLQGRLTTDSSLALVAAEVIVTRGPDRAVFRTRTDATGRWRIIADPGTGDYLVFASAEGRLSQRKRVLRTGNETSFTVDLSLASSAPPTLARVEVRASKRTAPSLGIAGNEPARANAEQDWEGVFSSVAPSDLGNASALAAVIPGLQSGPGGISALGLSGAQTQFTLNGMAGGGELPRGGFTYARTATTAWDVSRGGFSGAQVDVVLGGGGVYKNQQLVMTLEAPQLQATDAVGRALGQRTTLFDINASTSGSIDRRDNFGYSLSSRVRRRSNPSPSLATASGIALDAAGVSRDTVNRLLSTLTQLGLPGATITGTQRTDFQLATRVDRLSYSDTGFVDRPRNYNATFLFNGSWDEGIGVGATVTPSATAKGHDLTGTMQLVHTLRKGMWIHDTRTSFTLRDARTTPLFTLPSGNVRTVSANADAGGVASLAFGGNDRLASDLSRLTWETMQESQVYATPGTRHRVKLFGQVRLDASTQRARPNALGTYAYNSLDDLVAGRPASFTRTLVQPDRTGSTVNSAFGLGSIYRTGPNFAVQYGARLEGNAFLRRPDANTALLQSLGVRTDASPRDWGISPRFGIRWVYNKKADNNSYRFFTPAGVVSRQPTGVLRGGVGQFRGFITPENIAGAVAATGLPASTLRLFCVGAAVPVADWDAFTASPSSIPDACANGAPALSDRTPAVRALDPSWRPPRSWRGNLNWSQRLLKMDVSVEGVASLNLEQPSTLDANFAGAQRFTLAAEGGRPVFVTASSIVPENGALISAEARREAAFGSVLLSQSRARSVSTQFRITAVPNPTRQTTFSATYVAARVRAKENGADRNTGGDPRAFEWAAGDLDTRHQVQLQGSLNFTNVAVSLFSNTLSGLPYTPIVGGDINGDGFGGNDRAFVTRGASASPEFQAAMNTLLTTAPVEARRCLSTSLERIASRNACRGPWSSTLNAQVTLQGKLFGLSRRGMTLSLAMRNVLAGVDQAVNGGNLRGWGTRAFADPVLYSVRGWDAAAQRFRYDVNPRFGATDPRLTTLRAPFTIAIDVQVPIGPTYPQQQLDRSLRNGRNGFPGPRLDSATLVRRYSRQMQDMYGEILQQADSLLLTKEQLTALQARQTALNAQTDAVWGSFAAYLVKLEDRYDAKTALERQQTANKDVWMLLWRDSKTLDQVLNPQQLKLLPWPASYLRSAEKAPDWF